MDHEGLRATIRRKLVSVCTERRCTMTLETLDAFVGAAMEAVAENWVEMEADLQLPSACEDGSLPRVSDPSPSPGGADAPTTPAPPSS